MFGAALSPERYFPPLLPTLFVLGFKIPCIAFVQLTRGMFALDAGTFHTPTPVYSPFTANKSLHAVT